MHDAVIVSALRTPVGKRNGSLASTHSVDLSAAVLDALVGSVGLDPALVEDVIWGCVQQAGQQAHNIARGAVLAAGWPESVPGTTIDRQCGSSQQAVHFAAATLQSGQAEIIVAGGTEVMSAVPIGSALGDGSIGDPTSPLIAARYPTPFHQGIGAEMMAERWGLSRERLDEFAARSHERLASAVDEGRFADEIVPITLADGSVLSQDEGLRRGTTVETLSGLRTVFKEDGVIHAGNSSQISDGSAALLMMTGERAAELGLRPIARVHTAVVTGDDPVMMLAGPIPATQLALKRSGLGIGDIDTFEVNEAFAPVPLAWAAETGADEARLNPDGGAIAVGHPLGASGARIMATMLHRMVREEQRYGLITMCEGGGMANATILEVLR